MWFLLFIDNLFSVVHFPSSQNALFHSCFDSFGLLFLVALVFGQALFSHVFFNPSVLLSLLVVCRVLYPFSVAL